MSWEYVKLGSLVELITKGTTPTSVGFNFVDNGINFIKIESIALNGKFIPSKFAKINSDCNSSLKRSQLKAGDILFSIAGALGRTAIVTNDILPANTNQALAIIRLQGERIIYKEFLVRVLASEGIFNQLSEMKGGVAQQNLSLSQIKDFLIPLPPLSIQKKIVAKLDAIFAEIDKATAATEANAKNAEALFQSYLTKVFGQAGEGWVIKSLLELANEDCSLSYGIVQPGDDFENGLPIVRPTNLTKKYIPKLELKTINPILADLYKRTTLTGEELLLCVRGTTGTVSISTQELKGCNVTRGIVPIRFKKKLIDLDYAYYLFNSSIMQKQIKSKTYGAALLQINIADVKKLQVPVPKIEEQRKIVAQLDAVNSYIDILKKSQINKKQFLIDFKQSILKQAFAGELVKE